jgi:tRNA nucleotidyltransferase (CCA-adding enzyme)
MMEVVVCHNNADFDSLGCLTAFKILKPKIQACFPGRIQRGVKELYSLYKDEINLTPVDHINVQEVEHLYITDTQNADRIGKFKNLFAAPVVQLTIIDHHPREENLPERVNLILEDVGAATTILVEEIMRKGMSISPAQATVLATAIYADTGCLTTPNTTPRDVRSIAYLLEQQANLAVVSRYTKAPLSDGQRSLFEELLAGSREIKVNDVTVCLTTCEVSEYVDGLAQLTSRLAEIEDCDASLAVVNMEDRVHIVGRSKNSRLDLLKLMENFRGKGHAQAASATVKDGNIEVIAGQIEQLLSEAISPPMRVSDVMSSPVRTVDPDTTMEEAGKLMLRSGHSGLPVISNGSLKGIISRRDLEKANHHGLVQAPVKGFMSSSVMTISPDASLDEVQRLMISRDIGRLPVVDGDGNVVGIVTRTDILRTLHGQSYPHWFRATYRAVPSEDNLATDNVSHLLEERLGKKGLGLLLLIGQEAERMGGKAYLVGGMVRDMIIGYDNVDVDIAVEPQAIPLAQSVARLLGAECVEHPQFGTATLRLTNGEHIDFATARTEFYVAPAAMPSVETATIKQDLYRRDFTINTLAVCLSPSSFGEILDFFGGRNDIGQGIVRVLYNLSFVEDPTRIIRAIRFEQRYGFVIEPETERFLVNALDNDLLEKVSNERLREELYQLLGEPAAANSVVRMDQLGVIRHLLPGFVMSDRQLQLMRQFGKLDIRDMDRPVLYLMTLFLSEPMEKWPQLAESLRLPRRSREIVLQVSAHAAHIGALFGQEQPSSSSIWEAVETLHPEARLFCTLLCGERAWDRVRALFAGTDLQGYLTGKDLLNKGLNPGPMLGHLLRELKKARIDGRISTPEEELDLLNELVSKWNKGGG